MLNFQCNISDCCNGLSLWEHITRQVLSLIHHPWIEHGPLNGHTVFCKDIEYILIQSANYTKQRSSWQANRSSGSWDFSFYGTWWYINVFTGAHHLSTTWATWIHSTASQPVSIHFSLLSHLDMPDGLFPSVFQTRMFHAFLFTFMHATCPTHLTFLYLIIVIMSG